MTEELDTGKEMPAQGDQDSAKPSQDPPAEQDKDKDKGREELFSPKQEQYIGSWMGRIIKKQFEESIVPLITESVNRRPTRLQDESSDVLKKFNEELSEQLFTDPIGAIQKAVRAIEESKTQLTKSQTVQVDKAITSYSEEPLYKDIYQDMKQIAHERAGKGYPSEAAAEYAFTKAKLNHIERMAAPDNEGGLNLTDGGRPNRQTKTPKLPPEFKKAYERDKAKGLFKTEAEYIAALSPHVRAKYDI